MRMTVIEQADAGADADLAAVLGRPGRASRSCIQYSPSLDSYVFYPRVRAPGTLADDLEWRQISGAGTLVSFAVAERPVARAVRRCRSAAARRRQWDEGPRFATELVDVEPAELRVGMPVLRCSPTAPTTV